MENLKKHLDVIAEEATKVFSEHPQVSKIIVDTNDEFLIVNVEIKNLNEKGGNNE